MAIALTNCDEYMCILNTKKDDDEMIREFFSDCQHLDMIDVLKNYPILFFKALDHLLENPELECLEILHDYLSNIIIMLVILQQMN